MFHLKAAWLFQLVGILVSCLSVTVPRAGHEYLSVWRFVGQWVSLALHNQYSIGFGATLPIINSSGAEPNLRIVFCVRCAYNTKIFAYNLSGLAGRYGCSL